MVLGSEAPDAPLEIGPPSADAAGAAILIHGRGRSAEEMRDIALRLRRPDMRFILPRAPGGSWYPQSFLRPIAQNEPQLSRSLGHFAALIDELLAQGVPSNRIVLSGFSQGACLAAQLLMRRPARYGAALIFTGGLIGEPGTHWPPAPALAGTPVLLTSSDTDGWIPVRRVAETAQALSAGGAIVTTAMYRDRAHMISEDEIDRARAMLDAMTRSR